MSKQIAPYGSWASPINAAMLADAGISLQSLRCSESYVYWIEGRPREGGRYVVVKRSLDGQTKDVTPEGFNARTLVHEYGGGAAIFDGETVIFSNLSDQRLYRYDGQATPQPITPEPSLARGVRYADGCLTPDGRFIVSVRETHHGDDRVINDLVAISLDGSEAPRVITSGYDFYSNPRISPDGRKLAWLCWNDPLMPWDGTELWVATLNTDASIDAARRVAGGSAESIFQPEWSPSGVLHFVSDRTNWWNLYREVDGRIEALAPMDAEFGQAQWSFGYSRYTFLSDGRIACIYSENGIDHLGTIAVEGGEVTPIPCEFTSLLWLSTDGQLLWLIGASPTCSAAVFSLDPVSGAVEIVRSAYAVEIDPESISVPRAIEFPTEHGLSAHAFFYPPRNADYYGPDDELPPLLVISHGGPTGSTASRLSMGVQFWTSRGFAVVDVNYGGSTGYGRAYRERLRGQWGIVDVMDCINAAQYLVDQNEVDGNRIGIRGGSAGGYTTLRALTWQNFFNAGASFFGLAELETFVHDTHKFEARYLDSLIGPYPEAQHVYRERSPVNFADHINCPVILLQGLEDKIVPPSQAETMVRALQAQRLPHAYVAFEGEQHGFREARNIIRAAEAELYFYSRVFGFDLADDIEPVDIANLD
ncbi:MAG: S9 family peptidase [Chloroflexi bacterium]|nr:S9 family peptidase [Chloroflexota bacterium]